MTSTMLSRALISSDARLLLKLPGQGHCPGQPLGRSFGVKLWPTFVLMRDGQVLQQLARPSPRAFEEAMQGIAETRA